MNRYLPDDNLSYPVLIILSDGSSGSGFYLNFDNQRIFLVTAGHVLYDKDIQGNLSLKSNSVRLISYDKDLNILNPIELVVNLNEVPLIKSSSKDIAIIEMGVANNIDGKQTMNFSRGVGKSNPNSSNTIVTVKHEYLKSFNDVLVSNEIFIFGYPNSLSTPEMKQLEYNRPLLRKGIIAGKNHAEKTLILDCPAYYGNSGGLAIEVEEVGLGKRNFRVAGVVTQFVPFVEKWISLQHRYQNVNFENSGYSIVVPTDTILELIGEHR